MKKIYKYMSLREEFFYHPMFRATPVDYLNDPFESNVQYEQIEKVVHNQNDNLEISFLGVNHNEHDSYFKCNLNNFVEREKLNLKKQIDNLGVISFTENYDNLLMWSHYANNHKGMVIELRGDTSWLDKRNIKNNDNHDLKFDCKFNYIYEIAKRVTYNSNRPKFDEPSDGVNCFNRNDNILDKYFFQKSSCWIYEQEHRSILPLNLADKIISEKMPNLERLLDDESKNFFTYKHNGKIGYEFIFDEEYFYNENYESFKYVITEQLKESENPLFLFSIDPKNISGIYFGCRVSDDEINKLIKIIKLSKHFSSDLVIKRAVLSKDRYELEFKNVS